VYGILLLGILSVLVIILVLLDDAPTDVSPIDEDGLGGQGGEEDDKLAILLSALPRNFSRRNVESSRLERIDSLGVMS